MSASGTLVSGQLQIDSKLSLATQRTLRPLHAGRRRVHNHIMDMFNTQKAEGFFDPVVDATTAACRARLPWWQPEARPLTVLDCCREPFAVNPLPATLWPPPSATPRRCHVSVLLTYVL